MTRFRVSLGWLMLAVALVGFHLAVISPYPVLGLDYLEIGLLPSVTALTIALFWMSRRRGKKSRPFVWGFVASLALAICVYVTLCLTTPDLLRRPILYYINEIEPGLYESDLVPIYQLSLEIHGLILGLPQLLFALAGGAVAEAMVPKRDRQRAGASVVEAIRSPR